jgi:hypothetical protein
MRATVAPRVTYIEVGKLHRALGPSPSHPSSLRYAGWEKANVASNYTVIQEPSSGLSATFSHPASPSLRRTGEGETF